MAYLSDGEEENFDEPMPIPNNVIPEHHIRADTPPRQRKKSSSDEDDFVPARREVEIKPAKINVDEKEVEKMPFDDVIPAKEWKGLEFKSHMGIIGATNAGKTTFFKTLLADQKIPICDMYILVSNLPGKSELVTGFATNEYLTTGAYKGKLYYHFAVEETEQAMSLCMRDNLADKTKCLFLSDCLISSSGLKDNIANFINKAKNYQTSVVVEIHNISGQSMVLLRNALAVKVYLNQKERALAMQLNMSIKDNLIFKYASLPKYDKVLIEDDAHGFFNKRYLPF